MRLRMLVLMMGALGMTAASGAALADERAPVERRQVDTDRDDASKRGTPERVTDDEGEEAPADRRGSATPAPERGDRVLPATRGDNPPPAQPPRRVERREGPTPTKPPARVDRRQAPPVQPAPTTRPPREVRPAPVPRVKPAPTKPVPNVDDKAPAPPSPGHRDELSPVNPQPAPTTQPEKPSRVEDRRERGDRERPAPIRERSPVPQP